MLDPNKVADYYNKYGRLYHNIRIAEGKLFNEFIEMPAVLKLLEQSLHLNSILDVGCGSGIYARKLTELGLTVDGIDSSEEMIAIAKEYCNDLNVNFIHSRFEDFNSNKKYDIILGSFILGYFEDLFFLFSKMKELLTEDGEIIVSGIHPIRTSSTDRLTTGYFIDNYFSKVIYKTILIDGIEPLTVAKHTFSDIGYAAFKAGLNIQRILEPMPLKTEGTYKGNRDVSFYFRNPSVVIFKFQKN